MISTTETELLVELVFVKSLFVAKLPPTKVETARVCRSVTAGVSSPKLTFSPAARRAAIWNKMWGKEWANYAIGGGAAFAFGTIIAVIYSISQGQAVTVTRISKFMKPRPVRPNVYHEIRRCGVYQDDWKYILCPTALAYILPFVFGWWIYNIPLGVPLGAFVFIFTLGAFTFLRASKPKGWLFHKLDALSDGWRNLRRPIADEYESEGWTRDKSTLKKSEEKLCSKITRIYQNTFC